jgi:hypothetical protein
MTSIAPSTPFDMIYSNVDGAGLMLDRSVFTQREWPMKRN